MLFQPAYNQDKHFFGDYVGIFQNHHTLYIWLYGDYVGIFKNHHTLYIWIFGDDACIFQNHHTLYIGLFGDYVGMASFSRQALRLVH